MTTVLDLRFKTAVGRGTSAEASWPDYSDPSALVLVDRDLVFHDPAASCDPLATGWAWLPLLDAVRQARACAACRAMPRRGSR